MKQWKQRTTKASSSIPVWIRKNTEAEKLLLAVDEFLNFDEMVMRKEEVCININSISIKKKSRRRVGRLSSSLSSCDALNIDLRNGFK